MALLNRISSQPLYEDLIEVLSQKISNQIYFVMSSTGNEVAFLFLSENPKNGESEKTALEQSVIYAVVVDPEKDSNS